MRTIKKDILIFFLRESMHERNKKNVEKIEREREREGREREVKKKRNKERRERERG